MKSKTLFGNISLIVTAMIWGSTFVAQEIGMNYVKPFTFLASRSFLGFLFLLVLIPPTTKIKKDIYKKTEKGGGKFLLVGGTCCGVALTLASGLQQFGLVDGNAGKAGFITAMYILLVPVWGIFLKKKVPPVIWVCVPLGITGLYFLCMEPGAGFSLNSSDIFLILCAIAFSVHIIAVDYFSPKTDGIKLSCVQFFVAFVLSSILAAIFDKPSFSSILSAALPICYAGIFSSGIAYTLQIVAQKYTPPAVASLIMSLESVFAVLTSIVVFRKMPSSHELIGSAIMFAAIIISQLPSKNQNTAKKLSAKN